MTMSEKKIKGYTHHYTVLDESNTRKAFKALYPEVLDIPKSDDFLGLMTLCNTTPTESAELTHEDLVKVMDEFPTMAEESFARQQRGILNQSRWENMIITEPRSCGKTQRMKDMIMYMRLGANFDLYSRNVGHGFNFNNFLWGPRFMKLRRRLYKLTIGKKS